MSFPFFNCPLSGDSLISYLKKCFDDADVISTTQFRNFFGFSMSTDRRMRKSGQYPRVLNLPGAFKEGRILLADVAVWIEQGGCQKITENSHKNCEHLGNSTNKSNAEEAKERA